MANVTARFTKTPEAPFTDDDIASLSTALLDELTASRAAAYGLEVNVSSKNVASATIADCPDHLAEDTKRKVRARLERLGFVVVSAEREHGV